MKSFFLNKDSQLRSGWKIGIVFILIFGALYALSMLIGTALTIILLPKGKDVYLNSLYNLSKNHWFNASVSILSNLCFIFFSIYIWKLLDKKPLKEMGLCNIKNGYKEMIMGLLFGASSITIVFIVLLLTGNASLENKFFSPNISMSLFSGAILFIFVGFGEEILGRGYVMSVLKQTKNTWIILITSSIIFSLLHGANPNVSLLALINIFLIGLLFGYMFLASGNIWMPIGYHIAWNYFQGYVWGFQVSGLDSNGLYKISLAKENIINGGAFGPEGGLAVTMIILIGFIVTYYYYGNAGTKKLKS